MFKLFKILGIICGILIIANVVLPIYGHFNVEKVYGFYAVFGFLSFSFIIVVAKGLQAVIARKENYYKPFAVDSEGYTPPKQEGK